MRELRFRAWIPYYNEMRYMQMPAEGYKNKISYNISRFFNLLDGEDVGHYIMQFTGLKDKNGNDIYEGDIVKYTYTHYRKTIEVITDVYWNYHGFYIRNNQSKLIDSRALMAIKKDGEVIGNLYETPSLIKSK